MNNIEVSPDVDLCYTNDSQIIDFIIYIYRPADEHLFDSRYKLSIVYDMDILSILCKFTARFDKKTLLSFSQWLNRNDINLTNTEPGMKIAKTSTQTRI